MSAAVALVLVMGAGLLSAGCVSQEPVSRNDTLPDDKFVVLRYDLHANFSENIGYGCVHSPRACAGWKNFFLNQSNGTLILDPNLYKKQSLNDSFTLFFVFGRYQMYQCPGDEGSFVYSPPGKNVSNVALKTWFSGKDWGNITLDSIAGDGTVALHLDDRPIVLKPNERWQNTSYRILYGYVLEPGDCSEIYLVNETLYNEGVFNKTNIMFEKDPHKP